MTALRQALFVAAPGALGLGLFLVGHRPARAPMSHGDAIALPTRSMYRLSASWMSDDGRSLRLAQLSGHVQVLALIFTRCASVCPTLVKDLQSLEARLPDEQKGRIEFTLITIDPEHDTLDVLRDYRKRMGLDTAHWQLLRGSDAQVRELSAALGFGYSNEPGSPPAHSKLVTVLGRDGSIAYQQQDVKGDTERLLRAVRDAT